MVTTTSDYNLPRYRASVNNGYDGVVRVAVNGFYASGSLLFDGQAVLTAAHLFKDRPLSANVIFQTALGSQTISSSQVLIHPDYTSDGNNDLAIVWLSNSAPIDADRYVLYRDSDVIGQVFELVGYGRTGSGQTGIVDNKTTNVMRLVAQNKFDAEAASLKTALGSSMGWSPLAGSQWIADFDSGASANDALGQLIGRHDLGLGVNEGMIAFGDSGGPALINGKIAGVASYVSGLSFGSIRPDVDKVTNSSFGEIGAWQSIGFYQQWLDQSLRAQYRGAPTRPEDVEKSILEGDSGTTSLTFFLLQFTGVRASFDQLLSVEYSTRDGTAKAGEDYLATQGVLILYPNETQAVIAVEIIGDFIPEPDEWFFLDVFNPVGGSFGDGITMLTGMRTILNDDGGVF
jgi:hypothetical protein